MSLKLDAQGLGFRVGSMSYLLALSRDYVRGIESLYILLVCKV